MPTQPVRIEPRGPLTRLAALVDDDQGSGWT
jgi:hypothetical protein